MTKNAQSRLDLHNALKHGFYDHAVICTYTFEPTFFEEYALDRFDTLNNNANITVIMDQRNYEQVILGPEPQRPKQANLRYLLHPVPVRGTFHAKIILLASKNKGRLIFGSANFTRSGITGNAELAGCYEYEAGKNEDMLPLFQAAFRFVADINQRWPGRALASNLNDLIRDARWLGSTPASPLQAGCVLLNNLDGYLWEQIIRRVNTPIKTVYVLSRYFDVRPALLDRAYRDLKPQKIKLFTQNGLTTLTPPWLRHPLVLSGTAEIFFCTYKDGDYPQPLHGKTIVLDMGSRYTLIYGSANFTSAALLTTPTTGNVELVMVLDDVEKTISTPESFCDPSATATLAKSDVALVTAPKERTEVGSSYEISLLEATLNEERLSVRADVPDNISFDRLSAKITFRDSTHTSMRLARSGMDGYAADILSNIAKRLGRSSSTLELEAFEGDKRVASSNSLLITNLLDIKTGQNVIRQRCVREAEQSAEQFFAVLRELVGGGDDEALKNFLTYCDIPFTVTLQSSFVRGRMSQWDPNAEMRALGEKNLRVFANLHDAAMGFVERHFRRLKRHTQQQDPSGAQNFLHIFRAIGGVLHGQATRLVVGLEANTRPLSREEWFKYREHFDTYWYSFKELMDCLWTEYLAPMKKTYGISAIRDKFEPDLEPIHVFSKEMLALRDRVERVRISILRVEGLLSKPQYFNCVFDGNRWLTFKKETDAMLVNVEKAIVGHPL